MRQRTWNRQLFREGVSNSNSSGFGSSGSFVVESRSLRTTAGDGDAVEAAACRLCIG